MLSIDLEKIRTIRDAKGFSQEYMADQLGISKTAYGKIERGETKASLHRLEQIASALELSLEELLSGQVVIYNKQFQKGNSSLQTFSTNDQEVIVLHQKVAHLEEKVALLERENELQRRVIDGFLPLQASNGTS
jgi:transcriptional regulator with XRE-family HTH domain